MTQKPDLKPLRACPFCGERLTVSASQINPSARCDTAGCWLNARSLAIVLDDPRQVDQFNVRASDGIKDDRLGGLGNSARAARITASAFLQIANEGGPGQDIAKTIARGYVRASELMIDQILEDTSEILSEWHKKVAKNGK